MRTFARWVTSAGMLLVFLSCRAETGWAQPPSRSNEQCSAPGPMAQIARDYAWRPTRADVLPQVQVAKVGDAIPVRVVLLDASGKLTNAIERTTLILEATSPSGKMQSESLEVAAGASYVDIGLLATEPGLTKLTVREVEGHLLESSNFVFVLIVPVRYSLAEPRLMLRASGERDSNVRADQLNYARVVVYAVGSLPARFPIQVWLRWDHGEVKPNPLIIRKGERLAEARWTSNSPVAGATVTIADVKPSIPIDGARDATINFVEPIAGIAFYNPPAVMNLGDASTLRARFYDFAGNFVKTNDKHQVTVSLSNSNLDCDLCTGETDENFTTDVTARGWGPTEITVSTPGYPPFTQNILIKYFVVLWLCVGGGVVGSLADLLANRKMLRGWISVGSFIVGIGLAFLACAALVLLAPSGAPDGIMHSRAAVLTVSLLGGWTGTFIFRRVVTAMRARRRSRTHNTALQDFTSH